MLTDRTAARFGGTLWTNAGNGRLITALRRRCESMTVAFSMAPEKTAGHDFDLSNLDIDALEGPYVASIARGFFRVSAARRLLRELEARCDVVLVQMPLAAVIALFRSRKPRVYQMAADVRTAVTNSPYYGGLKKLITMPAATVFDYCHYRLLHRPHARMVAHGRELLARYGEDTGRCAVSSSIFETEILSIARSRPPGGPFRVLYVGFLRHEKGVDVLLEAFEQLLDRVPNAELEVVGTRDRLEHGVSKQLALAATRLTRRTKVILSGHVPLGPPLFRRYADADVCVVPSRGGEGTPRVLIEARAFGCPVIGSSVCGIPDSITHERDGLLVPPGDPRALADAMCRVAHDADLRQRLIAEGVARVRRTTIENFADTILAEAQCALLN
jgi:glycosyltransferase involved in cell wall biosynthesis